MGILSKKLFKAINVAPGLYTPKHHHIFKTAASKTAASAASDKHSLLVRRMHLMGLDESRYFADISHEELTCSLSRITEHFDSDNLFFCGLRRSYFSSLSSKNLSPTKISNCPSFSDYNYVGSCGGVLCFDNSCEGALFWNPTTNEVKFLPPSDVDSRPDPAANLPLTILTVTGVAGFGYDSLSHDYKYLRWVEFFFEEKSPICEDHTYCVDYGYLLELYSLKNNSWKDIGRPPREIGYPIVSACVNGDSYWPVIGDSSWPTITGEILKFDFTTEMFSFIPFPPTKKPVKPMVDKTYSGYDARLFEFGESLGVVVYPRKLELGDEKSIELWVWNGKWWYKEFEHCFGDVRHKPLGFSKGGKLLFFQGGADRQLLAYDVCSKELKKKVDVYCNPHKFNVIPYVETMTALNGHSAQGM